MKIAYLIEAHTDINRLIDLCEALTLSGDVFIHIDKKNKDHVFWEKLLDYKKNKKQITILRKKERHYVAWAGFSQVECFKSLLRKALENPNSMTALFFSQDSIILSGVLRKFKIILRIIQKKNLFVAMIFLLVNITTN